MSDPGQSSVVIVDASVLVDLLADTELAAHVRRWLTDVEMHAPAHLELGGAWARRGDLRLTDALYVDLAERMNLPLLTTDRRLARAYGKALVVTATARR